MALALATPWVSTVIAVSAIMPVAFSVMEVVTAIVPASASAELRTSDGLFPVAFPHFDWPSDEPDSSVEPRPSVSSSTWTLVATVRTTSTKRQTTTITPIPTLSSTTMLTSTTTSTTPTTTLTTTLTSTSSTTTTETPGTDFALLRWASLVLLPCAAAIGGGTAFMVCLRKRQGNDQEHEATNGHDSGKTKHSRMITVKPAAPDPELEEAEPLLQTGSRSVNRMAMPSAPASPPRSRTSPRSSTGRSPRSQ